MSAISIVHGILSQVKRNETPLYNKNNVTTASEENVALDETQSARKKVTPKSWEVVLHNVTTFSGSKNTGIFFLCPSILW